MELKWALIASATSRGVLSSRPGRLAELLLVRLPLSSLAVLYHELGSLLVFASESFDVAKDCLATLMALATMFRKNLDELFPEANAFWRLMIRFLILVDIQGLSDETHLVFFFGK